MCNKELPDGTTAVIVNHLKQSAEENFTDIVMKNFNKDSLTDENIRQIYVDVVEFANAHPENFRENEIDNSEEIQKATDEGYKVYPLELSSYFVFLRIAESICKELGDLKFAREVFERSAELVEFGEELEDVAESIREYLQDVEWSEQLIAKAKTMPEYDPESDTLPKRNSLKMSVIL